MAGSVFVTFARKIVVQGGLEMKRFAIGALSLVFLLGIAISAMAQAPSYTQFGKYKKEPPYKIGFSYHGGGIDYDIQFDAAIKWLANKEYGSLISNLYMTDAQFDVAKQQADVEDLIAKGIDGLIISPVSPSAEVSLINSLYDKGIPVVVVLGEYDGNKYTAYRASNAQDFGRIGAEWMVQQLIKKVGSPKGSLIVLHGVPGAAAEIGRWDRGAKPVFAKYPQIKIVGEGAGQWAYDEGKRVITTLLAANPKADMIWSCGGQMSLAAAEVCAANGRYDCIISGEDYNGLFKFWIANKSKGFSCIAPTFPSWIANTGFDAMIQVLLGQTVQVKEVFPPPTITDDTVRNYVVPSLPDTIWVATALPKAVLQEMYGKK
jgi:ribose transport system substrate-binding protein